MDNTRAMQIIDRNGVDAETAYDREYPVEDIIIGVVAVFEGTVDALTVQDESDLRAAIEHLRSEYASLTN